MAGIDTRLWQGVAFILAASLLGGCAKGSSSSADTPSTSEDASPGAACLRDASASRTPAGDVPSKIGVSHILVRHRDLERPEGATRSREEACLLALEAISEVQESGDWNAAVEKYSDSGKSSHGDLGQVSRDELTESFANAAFSLEVNELSYVVESDRGFHVILRTE